MVSQRAVFVDAGFLLAVGGTQVVGTSLRSAFRVDYGKLIAGIMKCTEEHSGVEHLRTYWYDASKDALFTDQHKQIGLLPGVKVRLGRISFNGEQKGVDLKLGLDLVGVARNRAASVAYLVSGDDDLAEAVEEAQDLGMKVVLVGVADSAQRLGVMSVAEHLALRVDSIITLPAELIEECFTRIVKDAPRPVPVPVPVPASVSSDTALAGHPVPRPLPRPGAPMAKPAPPGRPLHHMPSRPHHAEAHLVYSSGGTGTPTFPEDTLLDVAQDVGESVAASWYGSVTQGELNELLADRPILPVEIDRVLLKDCAQRIGETKTDLQGVRKALRTAFWEKLDALM
ncbi:MULTISPECIES: NYN domain-containing protein [Arthrobacter]|uniref:NYN domain-containing protein n=1 Tax=Arthrobacter terricola TaxID=2547396 RepID=A0A4R5KBK6_9MICC|nr:MULTISPECIES: NYN domain-containing protein [Arthrobacter]MBT8163195.1 NYN domain-containing protein [Arthrobacter sp. GN70]TDF91547.1 NYN domain-containing protein [Arthrobacter terricola]